MQESGGILFWVAAYGVVEGGDEGAGLSSTDRRAAREWCAWNAILASLAWLSRPNA